MSKSKKKRARNYNKWFENRHLYHEEGQYSIFPCKIWNTKLFHLLPNFAKTIYSEFRNRCSIKEDLREKIAFTFKDALKIGVAHKQFTKALFLLEDNGFIKCTEKGGLLNNPSLFNLTSDWFINEQKLLQNEEKYLSEHFPEMLKRKKRMNNARRIKMLKIDNKQVIELKENSL